jgi:hypothetical protein
MAARPGALLPCPRGRSLTSALPTVPLADGLGHLLGDPDAVPVEPFVAVVAAAAEGRRRGEGRAPARPALATLARAHIMKQLMSGLRQMQ